MVVQPPAANGSTPATVTFDNVTGEGITSLSVLDTCPPSSGTFTFGDSCYDLSTTATFTGNIEVCLEYDEGNIPGMEMDLILTHWDTTLVPANWVGVTTGLDTLNNVICGTTTHLSPFAVAVSATTIGVPDQTSGTNNVLSQNLPNPFAGSTAIRFRLDSPGPVKLVVYDLAGRMVATLSDGMYSSGTHLAEWDGRNQSGARVSASIYYYKLQTPDFQVSRKLLLLR